MRKWKGWATYSLEPCRADAECNIKTLAFAHSQSDVGTKVLASRDATTYTYRVFYGCVDR